MAGSQWTATELKEATRMVPVDRPWMEDTVSRSRSSAERISRMAGRMRFPSEERRTPARLRVRSLNPNSSSREERAWLTADWVSPMSSAARLTLPASITWRNTWYF